MRERFLCQSQVDWHPSGGGGDGDPQLIFCSPHEKVIAFLCKEVITCVSLRGVSIINMERINSQHFTVNMNGQSPIANPWGSCKLCNPTISVWSMGLQLVTVKIHIGWVFVCINGCIFNFFSYFSAVQKVYLKSIQYGNWLCCLIWWQNKIFWMPM